MTADQATFLRAKLHRPHAIAGSIERPRLLEKLDQVLQQPVTLISAPAGFGKTTLLVQWLERCPLPNAWLQLDENDHEIPAFLSGVVAALRQLFPGCLQKTADLQHAQGNVPLAIWKSALIADLDLLEDTPFILALDDYHLVGNPTIDLLLADVLRYESLPLHLILSTRRSPSPKWLVMLDTLTPLKAIGMGAILVLISGKFWVFTLSAIGIIEQAHLGQPSSILAFLLFMLLAQSLLLLAIIGRVIVPEQSKSITETISAWLTKYNRPIVLVVSLVFGLLFFVQGASGLLQ